MRHAIAPRIDGYTMSLRNDSFRIYHSMYRAEGLKLGERVDLKRRRGGGGVRVEANRK